MPQRLQGRTSDRYVVTALPVLQKPQIGSRQYNTKKELEKGRQIILNGFCYHKKHKESYINFPSWYHNLLSLEDFQGSIDKSITKQVQYKKGRRANIVYIMKHPAVTRFLHNLLYLFTGRNGYQKQLRAGCNIIGHTEVRT